MPQPRIALKDSRRHISQATAIWLIACGTHRWALEQKGKTLERVPVPEQLREKPVIVERSGPYIPEKLPPVEVPGCRFRDPLRPLRPLNYESLLRTVVERASDVHPKKPCGREVLASEELPAGAL